jgi:hypothetical protein
MSSAAPPKPTPRAPGPRPAPSGAPSPGGGAPTIDPIKLLKKWKYVLAASVMMGGVFGIVGHFAWLFVYPIYESTVTFEALPPQSETLLEQQTIDEDALEQFMATQADRMLSDTILERVAQDPRLQAEAPNWTDKFMQDDGSFDFVEAMDKLDKIVSARPVGGTFYVRMKVAWKNPTDAAGMARLLREAYQTDLANQRSSENSDRRSAISDSIQETERKIENLNERRSRLIRDEEITGLAEQATITREKLSIIAREKNNIGLEMQAMQTQLERMDEMVKSEGGVRYSDTQRADHRAEPDHPADEGEQGPPRDAAQRAAPHGVHAGHREYRVENADRRDRAADLDHPRARAREPVRRREGHARVGGPPGPGPDRQHARRGRGARARAPGLTRTITEIGDITDQIEAMNQTLADRRSSACRTSSRRPPRPPRSA